jgi:hypothetical protein
MFHRRRAHSDDSPKTNAPHTRSESRDARRTALPRSLLTPTLHSDLHCGNGSNVLLGACSLTVPLGEEPSLSLGEFHGC